MYRGLHFFLIFALKDRLLVLVRTSSLRRFLRAPTINVLSKNKKNITIFHLKIIIFTAVKSSWLMHGRVFVMQNVCCNHPEIHKRSISIENFVRKVQMELKRVKTLIRLLLKEQYDLGLHCFSRYICPKTF